MLNDARAQLLVAKPFAALAWPCKSNCAGAARHAPSYVSYTTMAVSALIARVLGIGIQLCWAKAKSAAACVFYVCAVRVRLFSPSRAVDA